MRLKPAETPSITYKPTWPTRRPAEDQIETITGAHIAEINQRDGAGKVLESLLTLDRESGLDIEAILKLLLDPANQGKLGRIRRGIAFAIRIKGALDQAGPRGNPTLRLIEENS
jgi:hypothetical protein